MKTINIIKILGIITSLFLLPSISNAQIQHVWNIAEYTSTIPAPPATGTKVAYRTLNNSLFYWNGSAWVRIAGPGIVDTTYSLSFSSPNLSLLGSGSSVSLTDLYTAGYGLIKTAEAWRADTTSPNGLATRLFAKTLPTSIANTRIAVSNGSNLVGYSALTYNNSTSKLILTTSSDIPLEVTTSNTLMYVPITSSVNNSNSIIETLSKESGGTSVRVRLQSTPTTGLVGTWSNHDFQFRTNSAIRATLVGNTGNFLLGTTTDVATSILTARSTTKSSSPFPLHTLAESDAITGVQGNFDYETTQNGLRWYNGTRKAYALESTFARGTATYVPFFDANGQITQDPQLTYATLDDNLTVGGYASIRRIVTEYGSTLFNTSPISSVANKSAIAHYIVSRPGASNAMGVYSQVTPTTNTNSYGVVGDAVGTAPAAGGRLTGVYGSAVGNVVWGSATTLIGVHGFTRGSTSSAGNHNLYGVWGETDLTTSFASGGVNANFAASFYAHTVTRNNMGASTVAAFYSAGIGNPAGALNTITNYNPLALNSGNLTNVTNIWSYFDHRLSVGSTTLATQELDVFGDAHIRDSTRLTTTPAHSAITGLLTRDATGWVGLSTFGADLKYSGGILGLKRKSLIDSLPLASVTIDANTNSLAINNLTDFELSSDIGNGSLLMNDETFEVEANTSITLSTNGTAILNLTDVAELRGRNLQGYNSFRIDSFGFHSTFINTLADPDSAMSMITSHDRGLLKLHKYGKDNHVATITGDYSTRIAGLTPNGLVQDFRLTRDTFIEDVTLFAVGTLLHDCQELTIVSSMTSTAATNMEIRFPDAADYLRGRKIIVYSKKKDAGSYIPEIRVVGGASRLYFTTNSAVLGTDPIDQSVLQIDDSTWSDHGTTFEFTCLKIDNTPSYRWVLKQR